jgi:hypothetical protein
MRKILIIVLGAILFFVLACFHYYNRWKPMWQLEKERPAYDVVHYVDDTLRIAVIGDSWAVIHSEMMMDTLLASRLNQLTGHPVAVKSKGKGGERSKGIYNLMFENEGLGTKAIITSGLDYCVVIAGINDAAGNLGTREYCHHMRLILKLLLSNGIHPVLIEIPDVDIWNIYGKKPVKFIMADYIRSIMTGSTMYNCAEYRDALHSMLVSENLLDSIVFVPISGWNGNMTKQDGEIFMDDLIHLNRKGYERFDSCIAVAIANDLKNF